MPQWVNRETDLNNQPVHPPLRGERKTSIKSYRSKMAIGTVDTEGIILSSFYETEFDFRCTAVSYHAVLGCFSRGTLLPRLFCVRRPAQERERTQNERHKEKIITAPHQRIP